jgi:hypothetical protein
VTIFNVLIHFILPYKKSILLSGALHCQESTVEKLLACWSVTVSLELLQPPFSKFLLIHMLNCGMDTKVKHWRERQKGN